MKAFVKDNRGVTLVELMIAVIIFAIITIPLLNSFKVSTMTAAKSEQMGRVSMAAQNIAQRIEASDVKTLISDAGKAKDALLSGAGNVKYYKKNNVTNTYTPVVDNTTVPNCIWLEGVSSGVSKYNALVEIAPRAVVPEDPINDKELSVYTPMQLVFSQTANDPDEITERDIVLTVEKDGTTVNAEITYSYDYNVSPTAEDESGSGGTGGGEYTGKLEGVEDNKPFYIHMLYTPVFGVKDNITIINSDSNLELFLVKKHKDPESQEYNCTLNQKGTKGKLYTNIADGDGVVNITYEIDDVISRDCPNNVNNYLVATQKQARAYNFIIKLFPADAVESNFNDEPLYELKSMSID